MKRRLPPHIVLPDGRWRFVKRGSKSVSKAHNKKKKVVHHMAKRRGGYRRGARRAFGGMKSMFWPIVAGVADSYLDPMLPIDGIGATAIGFVGHDAALKTLGLYKVGESIGNILPLPGRSGGSGGVMF